MPHDKASGAKPAGPCCLVIFGAAGDLTKRLVIPALYNLSRANLLPKEFALVGMDLTGEDVEAWKQNLTGMLKEFVKHGNDSAQLDEEAWKRITDGMFYVQGDLTDAGAFQKLKSKLEEVDGARQTGGNYLFYLAIADRFFGTVVEQLGHVRS